MNCERCQGLISEGEDYNHRGKTLCEDCYIGAMQPPKTCDVAAVHSAKTHRDALGLSGTEGLTELQKNIYNYIKDHGKATKQELTDYFKLPTWELDNQFATLRHCELLKGQKEGNEIYLVCF